MAKKNIDLYCAQDLKFFVDMFMNAPDIETAKRVKVVLDGLLEAMIMRKEEIAKKS